MYARQCEVVGRCGSGGDVNTYKHYIYRLFIALICRAMISRHGMVYYTVLPVKGMIPKKHRVNAAFRTGVDALEDLCGYVLRGNDVRAHKQKAIVDRCVADIMNCLTKIPATPMYSPDVGKDGHVQLICGYCTENNAMFKKASKYADTDEPTHLCYQCHTYTTELAASGIDSTHYRK